MQTSPVLGARPPEIKNSVPSLCHCCVPKSTTAPKGMYAGYAVPSETSVIVHMPTMLASDSPSSPETRTKRPASGRKTAGISPAAGFMSCKVGGSLNESHRPQPASELEASPKAPRLKAIARAPIDRRKEESLFMMDGSLASKDR